MVELGDKPIIAAVKESPETKSGYILSVVTLNRETKRGFMTFCVAFHKSELVFNPTLTQMQIYGMLGSQNNPACSLQLRLRGTHTTLLKLTSQHI